MRLVESLDEIYENISVLERIRQAGQSTELATYRSLIKRGTCVLPYSTADGIAFAPSRFIGYADNSLSKHAANESRDGRRTNGALNDILDLRPIADHSLEAAYQDFCSSIEVTPSKTGTFGVERKFWVTLEVEAMLEIDAENEVLADETLTSTAKDQIVKARIGQGQFRDSLIKKWKRCCLTKCDIKQVLRASHIKPWRNCDNRERLDVFNGVLLTANMDALFDRGLISFTDNGEIVRSAQITADLLVSLGCDPKAIVNFEKQHTPYLAYHREKIFAPHRVA